MSARVLFLSHAGVLGGAELSLLDLARGLGARARVTLFQDGPFRERLDAAGVGVGVVPASAGMLGVGRGGGALSSIRSVPGVLRQVRAVARQACASDVLYANSQKAFVVAALAGPLARRPVVWHLRDLLTAEHFGATHRRLVVALANGLAARVIANSAATAAAFVEAGGRPGKVRVVHNGIASGPFDAVTEADVRQTRAALGLGPGPVVGVFSRLAPWKGQHVLIDALPRLPGVQALFVGEALFGEDAYAAGLHARAAALGVADRVVFAGFRADVPALMAACDVVAHTSVAAEPFGRVVVEGMLAARPVVASDAGGVREIVDDGRTGRLVRPGDPAALADAVAALLARPGEARRMAAAGRDAARARFSVGAMVAAVEAEIDACAALGRQGDLTRDRGSARPA